jgi:Ca-activated chloride channel family protein
MVWLVTSVAIAGPTWQLEPNPIAQDVTPLVILLKADRSMSDSFSSSTSMQLAQMKIVDLTKERKGQPLGLLAYAGSAHWVLPPTRDTQAIAQMATEIAPEVMPVAGDRLDLALEKASQLLARSDEIGSILVVADSITADLETLQRWRKSNVNDVQVLAIHAHGTPYHESLTPAAKTLKATIESLNAEGKDVSAIIRRVSTAPKIQRGQRSESWHEAGWWLVPLICFMVLFLFRSEVVED